jgi:hypothetical protein
MLFTSIDKVHEIELVIFGDIAELSIITFHYENYKTFLLLLKTVIEYMTSKNINYVKQRILETDLPLFSNSTYAYTNEKDRDHSHNNEKDRNHSHNNEKDRNHSHNNEKDCNHEQIKTVLITTPIVHIAEEIYNALGLKRV